MSDDDHHLPPVAGDPTAPIPFAPPRRHWRRDRNRPRRPRVRKLRLLSILVGLGALALISTVFGMMMAVASDLPQIENRQEYHHEVNSYLYDDRWRPIGLFAPPNHDVIDTFAQISPYMRRAIVALEDKRFWTDPGIDIRGIGRALLSDVTGGATQGASTIAQQFVKNALAQESNRTILEKLREAALAFHLTHRWSKKKILTEYLNSIYFGSGAYGVESAARVYFGKAHGLDQSVASAGTAGGCGDSTPAVRRPTCASELRPWEAALLAGMVANPSAFDPIAHPQAARARRDLALQDMLAQHKISRATYEESINQPLPTAADIEQPEEPTPAPYFTSWLAPQILSAMGLGRGVKPSVAEYRAYYGGLRIRTSIDLPMQHAAEQAISTELPSGYGLPVASLVAIDNHTGEVRAMVGGPLINGSQDYQKYPFNLATEGLRQPGSAFKPFTLAVALQRGFGPDSLINSHPLNLIVPHSAGKEHFIVHNFGNVYAGTTTLAAATADSDNTVFTQVGLSPAVGTRRIARMAKALGVRTPISTNYSMILGGLKIGVSPLDMAHAYESIAEGGRRVYNPQLGAPDEGPTGIAQIDCPARICRHRVIVDKPRFKRVIPAVTAATIHTLLQGVVTHGTGTAAAISGVDVAGKTGTTQNYGDAWFVGWTPDITTAVWVGYPNKLVPMTHLFNGQPVEGGTFPAIIWHNFMTQALQILAGYKALDVARAAAHHHNTSSTASVTTSYGGAATAAPPATVGTGTQTSPPAQGGGTAPAQGGGTTPAPGGGTTPAQGGGTTPAQGGGTGATGGGTAGGTGGGTGGGSGGGTGGSGGAGLGGGTGG
ncbi:MAG TPA: transglycosylase domain-containing protein [Solirubrobacteraceae bacterium]|nr:transglycosylase domain-containing protein [Solirubrobacteraceae bacterium]